jgi:hypothetical protein
MTSLLRSSMTRCADDKMNEIIPSSKARSAEVISEAGHSS